MNTEKKREITLEVIWSWTEDEFRKYITMRCDEEKRDLKDWLPSTIAQDSTPRAQLHYLNHLRLNASSFSWPFLVDVDIQWIRRSYWAGAVLKSTSLQEAKQILTRETGWKPSD